LKEYKHYTTPKGLGKSKKTALQKKVLKNLQGGRPDMRTVGI